MSSFHVSKTTTADISNIKGYWLSPNNPARQSCNLLCKHNYKVFVSSGNRFHESYLWRFLNNPSFHLFNQLFHVTLPFNSSYCNAGFHFSCDLLILTYSCHVRLLVDFTGINVWIINVACCTSLLCTDMYI